ncbi:MAG: ATP-binding cassette subfamily B protein [Candidatus Azotimanducaceae bacterium]|jgi:ATP-binding cassette subfamily B protein
MYIKKETTKTISKAQYAGGLPRAPFRFMWHMTLRQKKHALRAVLFVSIAAVSSRLISLIFKYIAEAIEQKNFDLIFILVLLYPLVDLLVSFLWRFSGFAGMNWVTSMVKDIHSDLVAYTNKHSHSYFSDRFSGSLLSKVGNVTKASEQLATDFLWTHLATIIGIITSLILITMVDVVAGVLFLIQIGCIFWVNRKLVPQKRILSRTNAETSTILRGHIVDTFTNVAAVRQYVTHMFEQKNFEVVNEASRNAHKASWYYGERTMIVNSVVMFVFATAILYILVLRWQAAVISSGDLLLVLVIFTTFMDRLVFIGRAFNETAAAYGEMEEGLDELLLPLEIEDCEEAKKLIARGGEIEWNNVTFEFGKNRVFDGFNLKINEGECIGLVGPSGAGKTTFVSLLLRQHDIDDGAIMIDDQNIAEITQDSLRENIAVVPQEPLLFHRTIRENIAYGKPKATKKEIDNVAKKAQAYDFIMALPEKFNTLVGERGVKLSGGQKQRVAIARAMLKDAPILVLDEATSALDSESEVAIQKALHKLMEGKTVVAIAHRLSTLREMDRILVLEGGKIVEDGTHDVLSNAGGTYQRLWEHQAGGFLQD